MCYLFKNENIKQFISNRVNFQSRNTNQRRIFWMSVEVLSDIAIVIFSRHHSTHMIVIISYIEPSPFYCSNLQFRIL